MREAREREQAPAATLSPAEQMLVPGLEDGHGPPLEDLPPEAQGLRDEWEARSGIGRKEDVRAAADL